jgi:hypothetical protein
MVGGYIGLPKVLGLGNAIDAFLHPVFADTVQPALAAEAYPAGVTVALEVALMGVSVVAAAVGFLAAYWLYVRRWGLAERWAKGADLALHPGVQQVLRGSGLHRSDREAPAGRGGAAG